MHRALSSLTIIAYPIAINAILGGVIPGAVILGMFGSVPSTARGEEPEVRDVQLFDDAFPLQRSGPLMHVVGAHTEYHYLPHAMAHGPWTVSSFLSSPATQRNWRIRDFAGAAVLEQTYTNRKVAHWHSMVCAGDRSWRDYDVEVRMVPASTELQNGLAFRYRNDRCYYFWGFSQGEVVLKSVRHESAFHQPAEHVLARQSLPESLAQDADAHVSLRVSLAGPRIRASLDVAGQRWEVTATDSTYPVGAIGLVSDEPCIFSSVTVTCTRDEYQRITLERAARTNTEQQLAANQSPMRLWKQFSTEGFGVGRNIRFGDLNHDGQLDLLIAQVRHHGPKDTNSEVSCLTAMTCDGEKLWQTGMPDAWNDHLTNDVAVQIHDLDGDGHMEVIYCQDFQIIVADGTTGEIKQRVNTPDSPPDSKAPHNRFPRILGDSILFCDLRGTGRRGDLILKDRYQHVWAYDDQLRPLWDVTCNTGHYPYAADVDDDGCDELAVGYSLIDHDGRLLWSLDGTLQQHADAVALLRLEPRANAPFRWIAAGSDEGMMFGDMQGQLLKHHYIGHAQNISVADFRRDLPGLEVITMNFWSNQGIVHFYDARGEIYHDFEPCQHGSTCLPVNWTGEAEEYFLLSANVVEGGLFDGQGRRVLAFPNDGHPDMCTYVVDLTGDARDEIVVWDPHEIWIYTPQDPIHGQPVYRPIRNPLCNESNYRANVSLPGWSIP